jgi:hypothetical protein
LLFLNAPHQQGEISALINLARTLGGFAVAFFQVPWATKNGALQTFGCEAAAVAGLFVLLIPLLQWKGRSLRVRFLDFKIRCTFTWLVFIGALFDALIHV